MPRLDGSTVASSAPRASDGAAAGACGEAAELAPAERHIYRDDGYSGVRLNRPGLDRLRDHAAFGEYELVIITAPYRLARKYVHQVLIIEDLNP